MSLVGFRAQNHPQQPVRDKVDDRRTPDSLWGPLHKEFWFTLDVAASPENAKCARYFTLADDGLERSWAGQSVWCNPPYSNCGAWVDKAHGEFIHTKGIVMLLPANRTEQKWWQELVEPYRDRGRELSTRFLPGRLRFDVPDGTYSDPRGNRPPFGCVLLIWQRERRRGVMWWLSGERSGRASSAVELGVTGLAAGRESRPDDRWLSGETR